MIEELIYEMIQINAGDNRRINHALKVFGIASCIARRERFDESVILTTEAAAVLHDIAIRYCEKTYGSCVGPLQEKEGPGIARPILEKYTKDDKLIDRVLYIIAHHHTYDNVSELDYQAVIEADFIVNAEEGDISKTAFNTVINKYFKTGTGLGIARNIASGLASGL